VPAAALARLGKNLRQRVTAQARHQGIYSMPAIAFEDNVGIPYRPTPLKPEI